MIERQYSHRDELMPRAVYNFTILETLVIKDGEDAKKNTTQLSTRLEGLFADHSLMERYPEDAKKISTRPRWQVRFSAALQQLTKESYIEQDKAAGPRRQEGIISKRDVYSLTEEGKSLVLSLIHI